MSHNRIGVIGAGTMGSGIAQVCASAGLYVNLIDVTESALARGMTAMDESLQHQVRKTRICEGEREATLARVQVLHEGFGDPKYRPARLLKDLVAAGHLGRKSGRGFHSY